ncbi:hypothetical protein K2173_005086 [Erythroxylum novogranatense]|uniref:Protein kinase domain-containing protein n=1 Tax=Erythroxylum novogranatense TaxID=1862640 RepID=A0AAV8UBT6_9ROSI|nr:hypothetical protein K2173_005086 [Erythroxylum novogranatense]
MLPVGIVSALVFFTLLYQSPVSHSLQEPLLVSSKQCNETCGQLHVPFPFHLNTSCASVSNAFRLFCTNSTLSLIIDSESYRVLEFFSDGLLLEFPGSSTCRQYNDLNSLAFTGNNYFGLSIDNVIGLYDCEDSSLCKATCEAIDLPGCDGRADGSTACCYPLSDHSAWHIGDGFSVFSKFGCRGFSSWVVSRGSNSGKRGVKLEWAVPGNLSKRACAGKANIVNATTVQEGIRCKCQDGYVGDGFASGAGCLKYTLKDGEEANGSASHTRRHNDRTVTILAGVIGPLFVIGSLIALLYLLKRPVKAGTYENGHFHSTVSFRKASRTRLFTYNELKKATKGFEDGQKLVSTTTGIMYAGVLGDGSHVAVHKIHCQDETDFIQALSKVEALSSLSHRNLARVIGCCIDSGYTLLVVYEYPANGTLSDHLHPNNGGQNVGLGWHRRLNIAAETASILAFLQYELSPPIFHNELTCGCLFLDINSSAKIAGFRLGNESHLHEKYAGLLNQRNDVYDFGVLLLEMVTGSKHKDLPAMALKKIRSGKLEEIVDPGLYYHEQSSFCREQIQIVADLATRCLLFGGDGKIGITEVAREMVRITKEGIDGNSKRGPALEETFSNSSLLQMISMSPDSMLVP